jgi:hypothetical protein
MGFFHHLIHHALIGLVHLVAGHLPSKPPKIDLDGDTLVLRGTWSFRVFSLVLFPFFALIPMAMLIGAVFGTQTAHSSPPIGFFPTIFIIAFLGSPLVLGIYLLGEAFFVRITISREGIVGHSPWHSSRATRWEDITAVHVSYVCNWFVITSREGVRIHAHVFLRGLPWLAKALQMNLPPEVYARVTREVGELAILVEPTALLAIIERR